MSTEKRPSIGSKFSFSNLRKKMSISSSSSSNNKTDQLISPKTTVVVLPIYKSVDTHVESDSEEDSDEVIELSLATVGRTIRLNSQSPLSEIPKTWIEWDRAYATGLIDFNDPPQKPDSLAFEDQYHTSCGDYRAPRNPVTERSRQRALDNLGILETKSDVPSNQGVPTSIKKDPHNAAFLKIVEKSKAMFGVGFSAVNLVDGNFVVFMEAVGVPDTLEGVPRDATVCAHSVLAASTGTQGLCILDLKSDWRFKGAQHSGFYASHPIYAPVPFGETSTNPQVVAVMCIMDPVPRTSFTREERKYLEELALEAGAEFHKISEEKQKVAAVTQNEKRDEWSTAALVYGLENNDINASRSNSVISIPPPYVSDATPEALPLLAHTTVCPIFPRRRPTRYGITPSTSTSVPESLKSILHLATSLLAESIDLDFVYLLSVDLAVECEPSRSLEVISSHNFPMPPPLFDLSLHSQPILSTQSTLIYNNPDELNSQMIDGHFSTGLIVKVGLAGTKGFALGGFSEDPRKVLNRQDFLFFSNFAHDLSKHIASL